MGSEVARLSGFFRWGKPATTLVKKPKPIRCVSRDGKEPVRCTSAFTPGERKVLGLDSYYDRDISRELARNGSSAQKSINPEGFKPNDNSAWYDFVYGKNGKNNNNKFATMEEFHARRALFDQYRPQLNNTGKYLAKASARGVPINEAVCERALAFCAPNADKQRHFQILQDLVEYTPSRNSQVIKKAVPRDAKLGDLLSRVWLATETQKVKAPRLYSLFST